MVVIKEKDKNKLMKLAAPVIALAMAAVGYFYGDVRPAVDAFCSAVLN